MTVINLRVTPAEMNAIEVGVTLRLITVILSLPFEASIHSNAQT